MNEEELLGEIKRHIDYTNAMNEKSLRDLQIENLYNLLQQKENIIKEAIEYMEKAINSDSFTILPSGKITDIEYCIVAFEDLLKILKGDEIVSTL